MGSWKMLILNSKFSLKRPALFLVSYFSGALDFHGISQPAFSSYALSRHSFHSATDEPLSQGSFSVLFLLNTFFRHNKLDLLSHLREDPGAADEGHCLAEDELPRLMEEDGELHEAALGSELVALVVVRARRELDAQVQGVHLAGLSGKLGRPV